MKIPEIKDIGALDEKETTVEEVQKNVDFKNS